MRLPSKPRTEIRELLPTPPEVRRVMPTVLARISCTLLTVPRILLISITVIGILSSFFWCAIVFADTITSLICSACSFNDMSMRVCCPVLTFLEAV